MGLCSAAVAFAPFCKDDGDTATEMATDPMTETGKRVLEERQRRGWSQQEAVEAGKPGSVPSWRKIETGAADASDNTCATVDRAFGWKVGTTKAMRAGEITEPVLDVPAGSAADLGDVSELTALVRSLQEEVRDLRRELREQK